MRNCSRGLAVLGSFVFLLLCPGRVQTQEASAARFKFTLLDGMEFVGRFAAASLKLDTDLGEMTVPASRINDCQMLAGSWTLQVGNNRLIGKLMDEILKVRASTGLLELPVARIKTVVLDSTWAQESSPWPPTPDIKPVRTIASDCSVSDLQLSPDGKSLFYLEASRDGAVLRRLDTESQVLAGPGRKLPRGQSGLRIATDGKSLITFSGVESPLRSESVSGRIMILDPQDLAIKADFSVEYIIADLQPHPKGRLLVSGWGPKQEHMAVVDPAASSVVALWNIGMGPSMLRISADGKRAIATSLNDSAYSAISLPDDLGKTLPTIWSFGRPRGHRGMVFSPDEKFIVWQSGAVSRVAALGEAFPTVGQTVSHRVALATPEGGPFLLAAMDGIVHRLTPPGFRKLSPICVGYPWYAAVLDPARKRIYAATDRREKPLLGSGASRGDLAVFELDPFLRTDDDSRQPVINRAADGELAPFKEHPFPMSVRGMAVLGSPARFLLLDGTESVIRAFTPATGETSAVSAPFPYPVRAMSADGDRKVLHVFGAGPPDRPATGRWYQVDPATLAVRTATPLEFSPHDSATDAQGRLYVTTAGGARSELWILDPARMSVIGRWTLEADRARVRISPESKVLYLTPPFRACAIPGDDALAKPALFRASGPLAGVMGEPFQIGPGGGPLLFDSGVLLNADRPSPVDPGYAGILTAHRSASFLRGKNQVVASEWDGLLRVSTLPDLKDRKVYRTNRVLYSMIYDSESKVLCAASEGTPRADSTPQGSEIGGIVFFRLPE